MNNVKRTSRVNWDSVLNNQPMFLTLVNFAIGISSGRKFLSDAQFYGFGGLARQLVRDRGTVEARKTVRKALKRRGILNQFNVVNTSVYSRALV